jgi:transposase
MRYCGIDVSRDKLDCTVIDENGEPLRRSRCFTNNLLGFTKITRWLEEAEARGCVVVMEATAAYHERAARALHAAEFLVSIANAARVRKLAHGLAILTKNDRVDSLVLAHFGRLAKPRRWIPSEPVIAGLSALILRLEEIEDDLQREINRREQACVRDTTAVVIHSIDAVTRALKTQRKELQAAIDAAVAGDDRLADDMRRLRSIPAIGPKTAPRMLVLLRGHDFHSAREVAAFVGLVPVERQSGVSAGRPRLSKAGNPRLRASLYMAAIVALKLNPDIRDQYQRLVAAGKPKMVALGAAMRKLVHLCYGVWKSGDVYRPRPLALA